MVFECMSMAMQHFINHHNIVVPLPFHWIYPETTGVCSAHLINDGVTVEGRNVIVEWQGTGPSAKNRVDSFRCILDGGVAESCEFLV